MLPRYSSLWLLCTSAAFIACSRARGQSMQSASIVPAPDSTIFRGVLEQLIPWAQGVRLVVDVSPLLTGTSTADPDSLRRMLGGRDSIGVESRRAREHILAELGITNTDSGLAHGACPGIMAVAPPGERNDVSGCPSQRTVRVVVGLPRGAPPRARVANATSGEPASVCVPVAVTLYLPSGQTTSTYMYVFRRHDGRWVYDQRQSLMAVD